MRTTIIWHTIMSLALLMPMQPVDAQDDSSLLANDRAVITAGNAGQLTLLAELEASGDLWPGMAFSPDGRYFATSTRTDGVERTLHWWDMTTGEKLGEVLYTAPDLTWLTFSPDGVALITPAVAGPFHQVVAVRLWDVATGGSIEWDIQPPDGNDDYCPDRGFSPFLGAMFHENALVVYRECQAITFAWEARTGELLGRVDTAYFMFDLPAAQIITMENNRAFNMLDGGQLIAELPPDLGVLHDSYRTGRFSPDLTQFAYVVSPGDEFGVVDLESGDVIRSELDEYDDLIRDGGVSFSPDGSLVTFSRYYHAPNSPDTVEIWDAATAEQLASVEAGYNYRALFSPDGTLLASPSIEGTVYVWGVLE